MASKYYIKTNLKSLNHKYNRSKTRADPAYYSKLAIIELCGWIEISIDEMLEKHGKILSNKNLSDFKGQIKKVYGFSPEKHLKPLIIHLIGFIGYERLMKSCDKNKMDRLFYHLKELSKKRNDLAHTYIKGFTSTYDSP